MKLYPFSIDIITDRMKEILLSSDNHEISKIITYLLENNGKMLRPRLVVITASMYPHNVAIVRDIAVAVELIHMASLVHDDIIDHALLRRGRDSVNSLWGNHISVLTGDYLFASAFNLINQHGLQAIMENITETIQIMCSGEIRQMLMAFNVDINEDDYLDKTYRKTACLFASSCKTGALASHMPADEIEKIELFGLYLGYAYQIIDDILDFVSDSNLLGKPVGNDLLQGNITLPVIYAMENPKYGAWLRTSIQNRSLNSKKMQKVVKILWQTKALDKSISKSQEYLNKGLNLIKSLPYKPAVQELEQLACYLLNDYYYKLQHYSPVLEQEAIK